MKNIWQTTDKNDKAHTSIILSANEISSAETLWIKEVQKKLTASKFLGQGKDNLDSLLMQKAYGHVVEDSPMQKYLITQNTLYCYQKITFLLH